MQAVAALTVSTSFPTTSAARSVVSAPLCRMALACALLAAAGPLAAQSGRKLQVTGTQQLSFGNLIPGVTSRVLRTDPARGGRLDLRGQNNGTVLLQFTLPSSLTGPTGASMPLAFGGGDAGFAADRDIASQTAFDPRTLFLATLGRRGQSAVFLGGTAQPGAGQRPGIYSATITLTVVYLP